MNLSDLSIRNPVFAVMLSAAMVVFGYLGYRDMGVSQFPEIDFPVINIVITNENASPDVMDGDVTDQVEDAVAGVEGVDYIMSQSLEGLSIVTVYFRLSRNIDAAMQEVQNAVAAARRKLPIEIDPPVIAKVNPNNLPVMWLTLSGSRPLNEISDFAEKQFKPLISNTPEVGGVLFGGLQSRNIRIWVDAAKLRGFGLSASDVAAAIQAQHAELPAGQVISNRIEINVRSMGEAYTKEEFEKLLLFRKDNQQVLLGQVATIQDGLEDRRSFARFNRQPAVAIGVRKAIGGNLVAVCENVKSRLPDLKRTLPEGMELNVPVDYSLFVRENVNELRLTLVLGVILTAVVCFLFLGSAGTTLNICLSIPTSLIGTFFVLNYGMKLFGVPPFTINLMTLLGLSLSVGVVVDDAILVLENIYRHREMGASRIQAALRGSKEISFAAMAATFSIMAIFLPVAFMSGTVGRFFFQFGVTVGVAVFLSLICALTLTPMLCAFFLNVRHVGAPRRVKPFRVPLALAAGFVALLAGTALRGAGVLFPDIAGWGWPVAGFQKPAAAGGRLALWWLAESAAEFGGAFLLVRYGRVAYGLLDRFLLGPLLVRPTDWVMERMTRGYGRLLRLSLTLWPVTLTAAAAVALLAAGMLYFNVLGRELTPSEDQSRFVAHVVCPVGSSITEVDQLLAECERVVAERDDVDGLLTTVATEPGQLMNEADVFVHLVPQDRRRLKQRDVMEEVRRDLEKSNGLKVVMRDLSTEGFTAQRGDPVDFALQGDWAKLPAFAARVEAEMKSSGLVRDVDSDYRPGMPELQVYPDRNKMAALNITARQVADTVSLMVGGQRIGKYTDKGRRYDVRVRLTAHQRVSPDQLAPMTINTGDKFPVPLGDIASWKVVDTLPVINRYSHQRKVEITASPAEGVSQADAIAGCRAIIDRLDPAGEFRVVELGNAQAMRDTINNLVFALLMGVVIAYMILGVQFNSFVHPLTVLMALPFAVTGALVTLWWTGDTLNMMSMIGLILLMGLVEKNSIILVDYTNQLRAEGLGVREAVLKASPVRLRPILMTSIACIAGAVPAAVGFGPGAETRAPMARAIIGGIVLSTLITLILVPVFYVLMERLRSLTGRLAVAPAAPAPAPAAVGVNGPVEGNGHVPAAPVLPATAAPAPGDRAGAS
jgi:HAE1 family hydrophobic/amphiphilic exporter-1